MADFTRAHAARLNVLRKVHKGNAATCKLLRLQQAGTDAVLATLTKNWFETRITKFALGKEYNELQVADLDGTLSGTLKRFTGAEIAGVKFKVGKKDPPTGETRLWFIELQPTGESA